MLVTVHVAGEHVKTETVLDLIATPIIEVLKLLTDADVHTAAHSSHASFEEVDILAWDVNYFAVGVKGFVVVLAEVCSADGRFVVRYEQTFFGEEAVVVEVADHLVWSYCFP